VLPISLAFTMSDAVATQAVRVRRFGLGRRPFTPGFLGLGAGIAPLFVLALESHAPWPWLLLTGATPAILALVVLARRASLWWAGRVVIQRRDRRWHEPIGLTHGAGTASRLPRRLGARIECFVGHRVAAAAPDHADHRVPP